MKPWIRRVLACAIALVGVLVILFFGLSLVGMLSMGTLNLWVALVTLVALWLGYRLVARGRRMLRPCAAPPEPDGKATVDKPVACPACGAVDLPYTDGCCSYCGRKIC